MSALLLIEKPTYWQPRQQQAVFHTLLIFTGNPSASHLHLVPPLLPAAQVWVSPLVLLLEHAQHCAGRLLRHLLLALQAAIAGKRCGVVGLTAANGGADRLQQQCWREALTRGTSVRMSSTMRRPEPAAMSLRDRERGVAEGVLSRLP